MDTNKIKEQVKEYLETYNVYDASYEILIDELVFNLQQMQKAKKDIEEFGFVIDITRDEDKDPYYQMSRSLNAYNQFFKNVKDIITKIGLSPKDKKNLELTIESSDDELSKILSTDGNLSVDGDTE